MRPPSTYPLLSLSPLPSKPLHPPIKGCSMTALTALLFHGAVDVPFASRAAISALFVIELLPLHTKLQLYFTTFEIKLQGDQCISLQLLLLLQVF